MLLFSVVVARGQKKKTIQMADVDIHAIFMPVVRFAFKFDGLLRQRANLQVRDIPQMRPARSKG